MDFYLADYLFQQIRKEAKTFRDEDGQPISLRRNEEKAREWYQNAAEQVASVNNNRLFQSMDPFTRFQRIDSRSIGKMYMFQYAAKHRDRLPYYDMFPIVFPIEIYSNGFLGINLHYLRPYHRAWLMDELFKLKNNDSWNKNTKLQEDKEAALSYQFLKSVIPSPLFKPTLHRYLISDSSKGYYAGVVSPNFYYINPGLWDYAALLPTQRFVKGIHNTAISSEQVWLDSNSARYR